MSAELGFNGRLTKLKLSKQLIPSKRCERGARLKRSSDGNKVVGTIDSVETVRSEGNEFDLKPLGIFDIPMRV